MKQWLVSGLMVLLVSASVAHGYRLAPKEVEPVSKEDVEYRAPRDQMGCVEAWDTKRNEMMWRRQVYVVVYATDLEGDVQDVFVRSLKVVGKQLIVVNERGSTYAVDLATLQVAVLDGSLVVRHGAGGK